MMTQGGAFQNFVDSITSTYEAKIHIAFAWLPKRASSGRLIWLRRYYQTYKFNFLGYMEVSEDIGPIPFTPKQIFTEDEYLWHKLAGRIIDNKLIEIDDEYEED